MAKHDKKLKTSNSLQDLAKLTGMEREVKSVSAHETAQNFYSFLHKRKRFYENDVKTVNPSNQRETTHHKRFDIKKINVEASTANGRNVNHTDLLKTFKFWNDTKFYQNFAKRHKDNAELLTNKQLNVQNFKPDWRLVVGLGSGSVFETSISLHHVYGFPYIPASAIKGALRSYLITTLKGNKANSEALLFHDSKEMCDIFGCGEETIYEEDGQKKRMTTFYKRCFDEDKRLFGKDVSKYRYPDITEKEGDVIFFDAYPTHSPQGCIKADIMNPHYPNYYGYDVSHSKFEPPADYQSPVPIIFLTVENLTFQFMVGLRKGVENQDIMLGEKSGDMLSVVSGFLKEALQEHGIGAKTAVGYGYMKAQEQ